MFSLREIEPAVFSSKNIYYLAQTMGAFLVNIRDIQQEIVVLLVSFS
jgi:hypothetical protein